MLGATVGVDANTGVYRADGVASFRRRTVYRRGDRRFSVSEILLMLEHTSSGQKPMVAKRVGIEQPEEGAQCIGTTLRSSVIGFCRRIAQPGRPSPAPLPI